MLSPGKLCGLGLLNGLLLGRLPLVLLASRAVAAPLAGAQVPIGQGQRVCAEQAVHAHLYCCGTTVRQAYERRYKVVFGSDVTATDDESRQEQELAVLRRGFALMLTGEEIANRLTAAAAASDDQERANVA
ncbi:hypothetical protein AB0C70_27185 [Streptomyces sp. NPDC048564]|uniref:hypothetical protein n=1 Tax=Streptomyces sp. NPDC048564 TaxID=3155760 RepID=UPI0034244590